jgi:sugar O-acyltransferase (sialic acid O-acetyltransferase NeuD family)
MTANRNAGRRYPLPADCRRLMIVGAGGFGRELLQWSRQSWPDCCDRIAGFLSDDLSRLDGLNSELRIVGTVRDYAPIRGDYLLLGIGLAYTRRKVAESLANRGALFLSLIHPTAIVASTAVVGVGSVICPYAIVSDAARLGRHSLLNYHSSLGHDASVGDYSVLSPYATLGGNAHVGDDVFLGLHASVGPGVRVGERSKISANSCALKDAPPESIVYGVPGKIGFRVELEGIRSVGGQG